MSEQNALPPGRADAPVVERTVRVESVEDGFAWVVAEKMSGCGGCSEKAGCAHAALSADARPLRLRVENRLGAQPGDWVGIGMPAASLLGSMGLAYGLPVAGFLAGVLAGSAAGTLAAMAGGAAGFVLALFGCRRLLAGREQVAAPAMLRRMPPPATTEDECCRNG